jgi:hypothetical protein
MFALLTEFLSEQQQAIIISEAIERQGKGLTAPESFRELPLTTVIESVITKVMAYKNSYVQARLAKMGETISASIWCDRFADFAIFLRSLAPDVEEFEAALLQKYPLISHQELEIQAGGLRLGYWLLFAKVENIQGLNETKLTELARYLQPYLSSKPKEQSSHTSFTEELNNYIHAKQRSKRGEGTRSVCAITGKPASAVSASGSPYKVWCYSNRRPLGSSALKSYLSPQWQKELILRKIMYGSDDKHEKVWVYSNVPIDSQLPMRLMPMFWAIRKACEIALQGGKVLVSPSVVPHAITHAYEIELFPDWLTHFGCKGSGTQEDAERILSVLNVLIRMHNVKPLGPIESSVMRHGLKTMSNPLYVCEVLPKESTSNVQYLQKALQILGCLE